MYSFTMLILFLRFGFKSGGDLVVSHKTKLKPENIFQDLKIIM